MLRRHLFRYIKRSHAKISVYRRPQLVVKTTTSRQIFCGFATTPEDKGDYEIDLISLKKTPKELKREIKDSGSVKVREPHTNVREPQTKVRVQQPKDLRLPQIDLSKYDSKDLKDVSDLEPPGHSANKDYDNFVGRFYPQIQLFNKFIEIAKSSPLSGLSQTELMEVLNEYKMLNALPPKDVDSLFMANRLSQFLAFDNNFCTKLTKDLIPQYQKIKISNDGLPLFSDELISLSKEFDFDALRTAGNLATQLEKYLDPYHFSVNIKDHDLNHHLDATFFKLSVQAHRYKTLTTILNRNKETKLSQIVEIANTQSFSQPSDVARVHLALVAPFYKLLTTLKVMDEFKDYDSFIDVAPKLYELSYESPEFTIRSAAEEVVSRFFTLYCLGITRNQKYQDYFKQYMDETYEVNSVIQPFTKDIDSYCATALYDSAVLNSAPMLKLFEKYYGSFENCSKDEFLFSLQCFKQSASSKELQFDIAKLENSILYLFKNMPWVEVSIFDTLLHDSSWTSSLVNTLESIDLDTAAQLNSVLLDQLQSIPPDTMYLKAFNTWLEGTPVSSFNKETATKLLANFDNIWSQTPLENVEKHLYANISFADSELDCLQILQQDILMESFENCSSTQIIKILDSAIERVFNNDRLLFAAAAINHDNVVKFVRLRKRLTKLFQLNSGYTPILDSAIKETQVIETKEKPIPQETYVQIPDELALDSFVTELEIFRSDELKKLFAESSSTEVLQLLKARTDEIYNKTNTNPQSRMTSKNVLQFVRLTKKLESFLNGSGANVAILDNFIQNQKRSDSVKISKSEIPVETIKPYVQLPDDLQLDKFHKQLGIFRDDELRKNYSVSSVNEINSLLDTRINEVMNNLPSSNSTSRMTQLNVYDFVKLSKRLARLFEVNGGNTGVLDTLINSQNVFEQFEKKSVAQKLEYKQMPDDFHMEEYIAELIQLRNALGLEFKLYSPLVILTKLKTIASEETNPEKRFVWNILYRNLTVLFKINNDSTFVLDSVLINHDVFMKFESNKTINHIGKEENSCIGENGRLVNNYYEYVGNILRKLKLLEKDGIWNMSESSFYDSLKEFEAKLDVAAYDYPIYLNLIEQLKTYNSKIEYYPNFLQQLYEIKTNNMEKNLNSTDVEVIYKAFIENFEYESLPCEPGLKSRIVIPMDEKKTNKFDLNKFINEGKENSDDLTAEEVIALSTDYNDSEKLISLLTKQEGPIDLENSQLFRPRLADDDYAFELEVKDALSIALKTTSKPLVPEAHKKVSRAKTIPSTAQTKDINKSSLEQFLQNAKKDSDFARENKVREAEAYEWSKSMYNSHRSLESRLFFDPLVSKPSRKGLFFPGYVGLPDGERDYLVLTLDGQTISWDRSSEGVVPQQDIFKILNQFNKSELKQLLKVFNKLQRRGWKLVGTNVEKEDQKYLILSRLKTTRKSTVVSWLKSLFATTGVVLISLAGLSLWMDTKTLQDVVEESESGLVADKSVKAPGSPPTPALQAAETIELKQETLLPDPATSSWLKKLFWTER